MGDSAPNYKENEERTLKKIKAEKVSKYRLQTKSSNWNSTFNYEQAGKARASFQLLSSVNQVFPLASSNSNVIETMYANLLRH